jgi:hypothetical protein
MIIWWAGALLGALGGAVADGSKIAKTMLRTKKSPCAGPGQAGPFVLAIVIRVGCAASVGGVLAAQQMVGWSDSPVVVFLIGTAAPTVIQEGARVGRACVRAILSEYSGRGGG